MNACICSHVHLEWIPHFTVDRHVQGVHNVDALYLPVNVEVWYPLEGPQILGRWQAVCQIAIPLIPPIKKKGEDKLWNIDREQPTR
jgi:hypothetical protein